MSKRINFVFKDEAVEALEEVAEKLQITTAQAIRNALNEYINKNMDDEVK